MKDLSFFASTTVHTGSVASATDQQHTGSSSLKCVVSGAFGQAWASTAAASAADAGRRISMYMRFSTVAPSVDTDQFTVQTSGGARATIVIRLTTAGKLLLAMDGGGNTTGTTVLSANTWYRISVSYKITSASSWTVKVWIGGVLEITKTQADGTLNFTGTNFFNFGLGSTASDPAVMTTWIDDMFIDDGTGVDDPGNVLVTAKRPFANGTTNGFTGTGTPSGYGTGNARYVNEQDPNTSNFVSVAAAGSAVTEEYNIEGAAVGDVDASAWTLKAVRGWVYAKALVGETANIIVDNTQTNKSLTSTVTLFTQDSATPTAYPAGTGTDVGLVTSTTVTTVTLYECGIIVAGTPPTGASPFFGTTDSSIAAPLGAGARTRTAAQVALHSEFEVRSNPQPKLLQGKDLFFRGAGDAPNYDWPNPRGYVYPQSLRIFEQSLKIVLAGKDKQFLGPGQWKTYDWPNPLIPRRSIDLITIADASEFWLLKDRFFGLAGNPNFDWPVPKGYPIPLDVRSWIEDTNIQLIGQDQFFGGPGQVPAQLDWPVPRGYAYPTDLRTLLSNLLQSTLATLVSSPFAQLDWQNPIVAGRLLSTWLNAAQVQLIGKDIFFGLAGNPNYDWPNPRGYAYPQDLRTWLVNVLQSTLRPVDAPFGQSSWPNPLTPGRLLPTWLNAAQMQLVGKDRFFGLAGNPTYDWPVPRGYAYPADLRTWLIGIAGTLLPVPFGQSNWPVPRGYVAGQWMTQSVPPSLYGKDRFFGLAGNPNFNWPVPAGYAHPVALRTWLNFIVSVPASPFYQSDWPSPLRRLPLLQDWQLGMPRALVGKDKFFGLAGNPNYDWPVPKGYLYSSLLRTWSYTSHPLEKTGKDRFFGVAGNPQHDWPVPSGYAYPVALRTHTNDDHLALNNSAIAKTTTRWTFDLPALQTRPTELLTWIGRGLPPAEEPFDFGGGSIRRPKRVTVAPKQERQRLVIPTWSLFVKTTTDLRLSLEVKNPDLLSMKGSFTFGRETQVNGMLSQRFNIEGMLNLSSDVRVAGDLNYDISRVDEEELILLLRLSRGLDYDVSDDELRKILRDLP
jgi:hypothetical protein